MKPEAIKEHIDLWILIQRTPTGQFQLFSQTMSPIGPGFYLEQKEAEHIQTIELLKGNKTQLFHLEYPIK